MVIVDILLATICFTTSASPQQECHNVLIGGDTPKGRFVLQQRLTDDAFYGGDVLQFHEDTTDVYAIHRVWLGRPAERREKRIKSSDPRQRRITNGCINVEPEIYKRLIDCCSRDVLIVK